MSQICRQMANFVLLVNAKMPPHMPEITFIYLSELIN